MKPSPTSAWGTAMGLDLYLLMTDIQKTLDAKTERSDLHPAPFAPPCAQNGELGGVVSAHQ